MFICARSLPYAVSLLIVQKLEENFLVSVDYCILHVLTIKNRNIAPLIQEIFAHFFSAKFYSKFNIIAAFNEIRIRQRDKERTTFNSRYNFTNVLRCFLLQTMLWKYFSHTLMKHFRYFRTIFLQCT